ncbi:MAG: four helix bundle protein [Chloroflexi bacterium AL-W]|nr:four helix bundle protein [Blastochloris sp.]NOK64287.1 four helix bundle protein [Chloroflexi bacterium AL-N1]NOK71532.1 four helix bundle protein [Chloroflexi bacterium AL-N10]NOK78878.1 four helix bundle protein [Chloroflexi bacterium AL-N5]NOK86354.1 four helix bundle protein [Chloroflexi bacterium AL-W]NOK93323.1 four helix bundle protein [Chloroflexi bacterium AL-N15]
MFKSYRDLEVWKSGMSLAKSIYQVTKSFPDEEKFGLVSQMRRAAISIPSNLAEGHARSSTADFQRFISIALGLAAELETQVLLSFELGYLQEEQQKSLLSHLSEMGRMLRGLHKSLSKHLR